MPTPPLVIYATQKDAPPLRGLLTALKEQQYPAGLSVGIAGEATDSELDAPAWDAALLRWHEPEIHDVALVERLLPDEDEDATEILTAGQQEAEALPLSGGRFLVLDHLKHTQALYAVELQPALLADDEHPAWNALDVMLRTLAEKTDGLIYADAEGFYDMDGEPMVAEALFADEDDGTPEE